MMIYVSSAAIVVRHRLTPRFAASISHIEKTILVPPSVGRTQVGSDIASNHIMHTKKGLKLRFGDNVGCFSIYDHLEVEFNCPACKFDYNLTLK